MHRCPRIIGCSLLLSLLWSATAIGASSSVSVPGNANIFGAGHTTPPAPAGEGGGVLPPMVSVSPGEIVQLSSVVGQVWISYEDQSCCPNGPDGGTLYTRTDVQSWGGIAGVKHDSKTMFLVGVFLGDAEPLDPAPPRLDFSTTAIGEDFTTLSPEVGQVFFMGDGVTTGGIRQAFVVPASATRLFLGFADSYSYGCDCIAGPPGYHVDNAGELIATVEVVAAAPAAEGWELAALSGCLLGAGILVLQRRRPPLGT